jgi:demethylmenaquinone methyltransferase/2-methoxy-6-polyprenyl-1,4-benzoquinol methylase
MSGSGALYRRQALQRLGVRPGMSFLDVATGTGLVAREAASLAGGSGVIGLDPSRGMLEQARRTVTAPLVQARGEALPFGDARFDALSMGYALRHVSDLHAAFREYHRVLRPRGRVLILEISRPASRPASGWPASTSSASSPSSPASARAARMRSGSWTTTGTPSSTACPGSDPGRHAPPSFEATRRVQGGPSASTSR